MPAKVMKTMKTVMKAKTVSKIRSAQMQSVANARKSASRDVEDSEEPEPGQVAGRPSQEQEGQVKLQDFRNASKDVAKKQRLIQVLANARAKLDEKINANKKFSRAAEKELEELRNIASNKRRAAKRIQDDKIQKMLAKKKGRSASRKASASAALGNAAKRTRKLSGMLNKAKSKVAPYREALERAEARLKNAEKKCKELKANGEEVPADGERDYSAPGAWKPPGIMAAKERTMAKDALAKAKSAYEKVSGGLESKQARLQEAKEKLSAAKEKAGDTEGADKEMNKSIKGCSKNIKTKVLKTVMKSKK